jgi:hypothetical protein
VRIARRGTFFIAVDFSKLAGVDPVTLSRWENGADAGPQSDRIIRLIALNKSEALRKYAERMIELLPTIKNSESAQRPVLRVNANKLD